MIPCGSTLRMPFPFADIRIALLVHTHGPRPEDAGGCSRTAIPSPHFFSGPGKGGDDPAAEFQAPDTLILDIGNEQSATAIEKTVVGLTQLGPRPRASIATRP